MKHKSLWIGLCVVCLAIPPAVTLYFSRSDARGTALGSSGPATAEDFASRIQSPQNKPATPATTQPAASTQPAVAELPILSPALDPAPAAPAATVSVPVAAPATTPPGPDAPLLNEVMTLAVQNALARGSYQCSPIQGGAFGNFPFQDVAPDNGVLIGFRIGLDKMFNHDVILFIQPIYLTPSGEKLGKRYGDREAPRVLKLKGPPGYAVGAAVIRGGGGLDAITITFMRIKGARLDPKDGYASNRIGGSGGGESYVGGDGTPIIGICGRATDEGKWLGLGMIFLSHTPAAKPH